MWVDPDAGKTWEQLVEQIWRDLTPEMRARCTAILDVTGWTREELFRECRARFQKDLDYARTHPDSPLAKEMIHEAFPFGLDPLLTRSAP